MTAAPTAPPFRLRDMLLADHILGTYAVISGSSVKNSCNTCGHTAGLGNGQSVAIPQHGWRLWRHARKPAATLPVDHVATRLLDRRQQEPRWFTADRVRACPLAFVPTAKGDAMKWWRKKKHEVHVESKSTPDAAGAHYFVWCRCGWSYPSRVGKWPRWRYSLVATYVPGCTANGYLTALLSQRSAVDGM
jgi:hypothetical protein